MENFIQKGAAAQRDSPMLVLLITHKKGKGFKPVYEIAIMEGVNFKNKIILSQLNIYKTGLNDDQAMSSQKQILVPVY